MENNILNSQKCIFFAVVYNNEFGIVILKILNDKNITIRILSILADDLVNHATEVQMMKTDINEPVTV